MYLDEQYTLHAFFCPQDYGKESQAKDVIEEYFKAKKWDVNKTENDAFVSLDPFCTFLDI